MKRSPIFLATLLALTGCGQSVYDPRGVDHDETLLSVSASGQADSQPDQAQFQAGINNWDRSAATASAANAKAIEDIVTALKRIGIAEQDIQTRSISVQRVDWGDRKGQFQAGNVVSVTVRDIAASGRAIAVVTEAGANVLSGPDFRLSDPEKAANLAYASAYKAARARAEAYASAAQMKVTRVLSIRDAGGSQGNRYMQGAVPFAPPPVVAVVEQAANGAARMMPGQTTNNFSIQVDFALRPK